MSSRDKILNDIREALKEPMTLHEDPGPSWPPAVVEKKDVVEAFREKFEAVGGVWSESVLDAARGMRKVWLARAPVLERYEAELRAAGIEVVRSFTELREADTLDAVITGVERAVAETGSLGVVARPGQGRLSSVIAPVHIAVVTREQFIETHDDWLAHIKAILGERSLAVLITGPSRTGDIEGILTIGVHGPARLVLVYLRS